MSGAKRLPSSSVKKATASGRRVRTPGVVEGAHDLEPGEHAEGAVVAAAGADGVDVAAGHDRVERGVGAGPGGDDVADAVDPDGEPEVPHPPDDQLAPAGVLVGEGEAAVAPVPGVAHRGEGVEVGQQPLPVDRRHASRRRAARDAGAGPTRGTRSSGRSRARRSRGRPPTGACGTARRCGPRPRAGPAPRAPAAACGRCRPRRRPPGRAGRARRRGRASAAGPPGRRGARRCRCRTRRSSTRSS